MMIAKHSFLRCNALNISETETIQNLYNIIYTIARLKLKLFCEIIYLMATVFCSNSNLSFHSFVLR